MRVALRMTPCRVCGELVGELVQVAIAVGGDEGGEEDGGVVAGVDQCGGYDRAQAEANVTENERDAEEQDQDRPGETGLLAVERGEEDAGEDGGEDERGAGELVCGAPGFVGRRGA